MSSGLSSSWSCCSSYGLGLVYIVLVVIIWSLASILVQFLYENLNFNSPFLLTYICTSLFTILLPTRLLYEQCYYRYIHRYDINHNDNATLNDIPTIIPWSSSSTLAVNGHCDDIAQNKSCFEATCDTVCRYDRRSSAGGVRSCLGTDRHEYYETIVAEQQTTTDKDDNHQYVRCKNEHDENLCISTRSDNKRDHECISDHNNFHGNDLADGDCDFQPSAVPTPLLQIDQSTQVDASQPPHLSSQTLSAPTASPRFKFLGHVQHFRIALKIAPIWFISNYAYNTSLNYTTIAASTVLSSSGSLFTYLFAIVAKEELITIPRMCGVLLCIMGSLLTGLNDIHQSADDDYGSQGDDASTVLPLKLRFWGDVTGLIAAVGYGLYTVLIKKLCPEEHTSVSLIFGYIGLINFVALSPVLLTMNYVVHSSVVQGLTMQIFGWICIKGLFDNVLSDYLWARAVQLTSATVATVGLALTVPLAFLSDLTVMGRSSDHLITIPSILGATFVLIGFILVNYHHNSTDLI